jgi:hypothetical protein
LTGKTVSERSSVNALSSSYADCVLTGLLPDRSALFGILTQIEALGLELIEIRRLVPNTESAEISKRFTS